MRLIDAPTAAEGETSPPSPPRGRSAVPPVHLAVPENPVGLALILGIFDRCGNSGFASSSTGSAKPEFPLHRGGQGGRGAWWRTGDGPLSSKTYPPVTALAGDAPRQPPLGKGAIALVSVQVQKHPRTLPSGCRKAFPAHGGKESSRCLWQKKRGLFFRSGRKTRGKA